MFGFLRQKVANVRVHKTLGQSDLLARGPWLNYMLAALKTAWEHVVHSSLMALLRNL